MTNGEKLKEVFPNLRITEFESYISVMGEDYEFNNVYPKKWWNAEYKEPTTKKVLKQEPCEDAVSRQQAIEFVNEVIGGKNELADAIRDGVEAVLSALPSVTPIRPKGHWREVDTNMYACSKCSHVLTIDPLDNSISEMNTCPFCGAEMREVEE